MPDGDRTHRDRGSSRWHFQRAASVPDGFWQKYLLCGSADTRADGYVAILFPGNKILYVNGRDLKDPLLSPLFGDMRGFPPAILTTGTRDLLLSSTVRVHRKLRQAGVEAALQVYEGQSHAHYYRDVTAPETREAFGEIAQFFDRHLAK